MPTGRRRAPAAPGPRAGPSRRPLPAPPSRLPASAHSGRRLGAGSRAPASGAMGCDGRVSGLLRRNLQPTLTYWSVFFSFGLCIAFLGPTLLDLRCQTHSSLPQISWVFFSQQLCLLLGSALGGVFKRT